MNPTVGAAGKSCNACHQDASQSMCQVALTWRGRGLPVETPAVRN
ncbi:MAG: hypothetical protein ETSY2_28475 [Candidatus Entotheonella gemina]|uniref:Uncharacterized protein n=1 Tax=Candidatus Entotheonella gemina TaxID=1429439 RepID=W4M3G1_9BACT|nr:MAG: hypothetical protein ETSY2_28475 [Candidatus Entotheonella gemina]